MLSIKWLAWPYSDACPGVNRKRTGLPNASTARWILVLSPPRDLPCACSSRSVFLRPHADGPERYFHPPSNIPSRDHPRQLPKSAFIRPCVTSGYSEHTLDANGRRTLANPARALLFEQSTTRLQQKGGYPLLWPHSHRPSLEVGPWFVPIDHRSALAGAYVSLSSDPWCTYYRQDFTMIENAP